MKWNLIKTSLILLVALAFIANSSSCKKDSATTTTPAIIPTPAISGISPNHGPANTTVIITGTNFSSIASENVVTVNGKTASIISAAATQITISVPVSAGTGNIMITVKGSTAISGPVFTYEFTGIVSTLAGDLAGTYFQYPSGVAIDAQDNIYVADMTANQIKKVSPAGVVSVFAGSGAAGFADGTGTAAKFNYPWAIKFDAAGNLYVSDMYNFSVRRISPTGVVTTVAGNGTPGYADGSGAAARFGHITGLAFDATGNLYVADPQNAFIRKITSAGIVSTVIFNPAGSPPEASHGLIVDPSGNIFGCDQGNNRIMRYTTDANFWQIGHGDAGFQDGNYQFGHFSAPTDIVADALGNMYVADAGNGSIRKVLPNGDISTVAGNGTKGYADGAGSAAKFYTPNAIIFDKFGNLLVADATNHMIRKIVFQ